jgi:hypothetical protein
MVQRTSHYAEIIVRVVPRRLSTFEEQRAFISSRSSDEPIGAYDALIYTELDTPVLTRHDRPPRGQPDTVAGLPLAAVEYIHVRWSRYLEYLAAFLEEEKAPDVMRDRLFETMSHGLWMLFSGQPLSDRPVRVWWANETPQLEDLPWELVAYADRSSTAGEFSFVRGLPPETPLPLIQVGNRLRLALIHDPSRTPYGLLDALDQVLPSIDVTHIAAESPLQAVNRAVHEGYELLHIVADGIVSLAYEGILYWHRPYSLQISASELSAVLRGSRVSVLALTPQQSTNPDVVQIGDFLVPSAYRAFAYLGRSPLPLPSIVAPLGPHNDDLLFRFWHSFYRSLGEDLKIEEAMARGHEGNRGLPTALFMRQPHGHLFRRRPPTGRAPEEDPTQVQAELKLSKGLVERLKVIDAQYGEQADNVTSFIDRESARQENLAAKLNPWLQLPEDEL